MRARMRRCRGFAERGFRYPGSFLLFYIREKVCLQGFFTMYFNGNGDLAKTKRRATAVAGKILFCLAPMLIISLRTAFCKGRAEFCRAWTGRIESHQTKSEKVTMIEKKGGTENGRKGTKDSARFPSPAGIRGCRRRATVLAGYGQQRRTPGRARCDGEVSPRGRRHGFYRARDSLPAFPHEGRRSSGVRWLRAQRVR